MGAVLEERNQQELSAPLRIRAAFVDRDLRHGGGSSGPSGMAAPSDLTYA